MCVCVGVRRLQRSICEVASPTRQIRLVSLAQPGWHFINAALSLIKRRSDMIVCASAIISVAVVNEKFRDAHKHTRTHTGSNKKKKPQLNFCSLPDVSLFFSAALQVTHPASNHMSATRERSLCAPARPSTGVLPRSRILPSAFVSLCSQCAVGTTGQKSISRVIEYLEHC